ncbi:MAG: hypothetical protein J5616_03380 [Bacteroidaceae bacterium]|nr:hypothetical protein [Bacteroidaceae bacterium]
MRKNATPALTLRNNPFRFKLDREPSSMIHCFVMVMERIAENFPMLVIETRALDKVLFGKSLSTMKHYCQYPFVMRGGKWDEQCESYLLRYFIVCWMIRKLDPAQFPAKAFHAAFENFRQLTVDR